ncbi:MAG: tyrosine-type recombinase/integrase [Oscillospiraceae bacterium]|jgi:site-specific recombinase XerD|nr:tyrosine-type recombinase/integrase [Oscillospiraceae bacterium]
MQTPQRDDYRNEVARKRVLLLRQIQKELPIACVDFFVAIEPQTGILTRLAYAYDLRIFFQYLCDEVRTFAGLTPNELTDAHIAQVTRLDVERYTQFLTLYYKNEQREDGTVISREMENKEYGKMRKLSSLRAFFRYLFSSERVPGNVAELVPLPKGHEKAIIRLDIDEVARILDIAESGEALSARQKQYHALTRARDLAMLTLFLGTGIRVSECVGLNLADIDFEQNAFIVTRKGGSEAILYLSDEVAAALLAYRNERLRVEALPGHEAAFFLSLQRRRISQRAVENLVHKYARIAAPLKRKISPHKLRSTYGTNLYRETGDIYLVADVLGHTDVNTTRKHYAAIPEERRREAARHTILRQAAHPDSDGDA